MGRGKTTGRFKLDQACIIGSFHAKSPGAPRVTTSEFNLKIISCRSIYMMNTCKVSVSNSKQIKTYGQLKIGGVVSFLAPADMQQDEVGHFNVNNFLNIQNARLKCSPLSLSIILRIPIWVYFCHKCDHKRNKSS